MADIEHCPQTRYVIMFAEGSVGLPRPWRRTLFLVGQAVRHANYYGMPSQRPIAVVAERPRTRITET